MCVLLHDRVYNQLIELCNGFVRERIERELLTSLDTNTGLTRKF